MQHCWLLSKGSQCTHAWSYDGWNIETHLFCAYFLAAGSAFCPDDSIQQELPWQKALLTGWVLRNTVTPLWREKKPQCWLLEGWMHNHVKSFEMLNTTYSLNSNCITSIWRKRQQQNKSIWQYKHKTKKIHKMHENNKSKLTLSV